MRTGWTGGGFCTISSRPCESCQYRCASLASWGLKCRYSVLDVLTRTPTMLNRPAIKSAIRCSLHGESAISDKSSAIATAAMSICRPSDRVIDVNLWFVSITSASYTKSQAIGDRESPCESPHCCSNGTGCPNAVHTYMCRPVCSCWSNSISAGGAATRWSEISMRGQETESYAFATSSRRISTGEWLILAIYAQRCCAKPRSVALFVGWKSALKPMSPPCATIAFVIMSVRSRVSSFRVTSSSEIGLYWLSCPSVVGFLGIGMTAASTQLWGTPFPSSASLYSHNEFGQPTGELRSTADVRAMDSTLREPTQLVMNAKSPPSIQQRWLYETLRGVWNVYIKGHYSDTIVYTLDSDVNKHRLHVLAVMARLVRVGSAISLKKSRIGLTSGLPVLGHTWSRGGHTPSDD
ncbi:hypothetical protein GQ54DRAFT_342028 [Martensiomyces pterosporus]|nr:hypothetical protein GQ54DRAFT_342028 [Martensiomyces pterosporus]